MNTIVIILQQTLIFTIPLLLVALGATISEKSGVTNLGLEGMMVIGAFAGIGFIHGFQDRFSGQIFFTIALIIAAIAGGLYSLIHAWVAISLNANQTISGTALNLFAPAFTVFVTQAITGSSKLFFEDSFCISKFPLLSDIPIIGPVFFTNSYLTTLICFIVLFTTIFVFSKTRVGLRLSACGEHPYAAASVGVNVKKYRYAAVFISGLLAGIGGMSFIVPTSTDYSGSVAGYGFLALSLVIFGQWNPVNITGGAIFFGFMKAISCIYGSIPVLSELPIAPEIYRMMPYITTLIVLSVSSKRSESPKALGLSYSGEGE